MQKKILAAVAAMAALPAVAGLTLFGSFDTGVQHSYLGKSADGTSVSSTKLVNGLLKTSKLGVKADQAVFENCRAGFVGEMQFSSVGGYQTNPDSSSLVPFEKTGAFVDQRLFTGDLYLFVDGCLGKVAVGRYTDLYANVAAALDAVEGGTSATVFNLVDPFGGGFRSDNNVSYHSPEFYGMTLSALYSFGDQDFSLTGSDTNLDKVKRKAGVGYGAALQFEDGPLYAGAGVSYTNVHLSSVNTASVTSDAIDYHMRVMAGASYDLCFVRPSAAGFYATFQNKKAYGGHLGVVMPLAEYGAVKGTVGYVQVSDDASSDDVANRSFLVGGAYQVEFTRNFSVYAGGAYLTNTNTKTSGLVLNAASAMNVQPRVATTTGDVVVAGPHSPYVLEFGVNFSF